MKDQRLFRRILALLFFAAVSASSWADSVYIMDDGNLLLTRNNMQYVLYKDTKEAMVGNGIDEEQNALVYPGLGDPYWDNPGAYDLGWSDITIPSEISYNQETYTVTSIARRAFARTTAVHKITLPETITSISSEAFYWCVNLEEIKIPNGVTTIEEGTFVWCKSLKTIEIPSVVEIRDNAFSDCIALEELTIPQCCVTIGNDAFKWCRKLSKLHIEDSDNVLTLGYCYSVGINYVSTSPKDPVYRGQFADCPLTEIYLGRDVSFPNSKDNNNRPCAPFERGYLNYFYIIGSNGYISNVGPLTLEIGNHVTNLPNSLFATFRIKNDIILPNSLKTIGSGVFSDAIRNQKDLTIPASVTSIGSNAFGCNPKQYGNSLQNIYINAIIPPSSNPAPFGECAVYVPSGTGKAYRDSWGGLIIDNDDEIVSVNVKTAGTLYSRLLAQDIQLSDVVRIKLKGILNDDDINILKNIPYLYDWDLSEMELSELPENLFSENNNLQTIKLPHILERVNDGEFRNCTHLTGIISFPATCTTIGSNAFENTSVEGISYAGPLSIGSEAFINSYKFREINISRETNIGNNAFEGTAVTTLFVDAGSTIGDNAFKNSNLTEAVIEDDVLSIGNNALGEKLEKITFRGNVGAIGTINTTNLKEIHVPNIAVWCNLPANLDAEHLLVNDEQITDIIIPNTINTIREKSFSKSKTLKTVRISDGVLQIDNNAFSNCSELVSVTLPSTLTDIGNSAFYGCIGLSDVSLPSSLVSIGNDAFSNCTNLIAVDFPLSVSSLGEQAYKGCTNLTKVVAHWHDPFALASNVFTGVSTECYLYIPIVSATKYTNAGWNVFPYLKEAGILSITANSGGTVSCYDTSISDGKDDIFFTPYKSFYVNLTPEDGFAIKRIKLNEENVISQVEDGKLFLEEPEEDMMLSVVFADASIEQGDVNGDGTINQTDAISIVNHILKTPQQDFFDYWGDMNDDGEINITDVIFVISKYLNK